MTLSHLLSGFDTYSDARCERDSLKNAIHQDCVANHVFAAVPRLDFVFPKIGEPNVHLNHDARHRLCRTARAITWILSNTNL